MTRTRPLAGFARSGRTGVQDKPERIPEVLSPESAQRRKARRRGPGEPFLKGPVPLAWLEAAGRLGGKAVQVSLALWYRVGLTGSARVTVAAPLLARFGVGRSAYYNALEALEAAGLVSTTKRAGKTSVVRILRRPPSRRDMDEKQRDGESQPAA